MKKLLIPVILGILLLVIAACGGDDPTAVPAATTASVAPQATSAPVASSGQTAPSAISLTDAAAKLAGGPGSIYIGDFQQLVGPAPAPSLGDADDMINLAGLQRESYLFDSEYYRNLVTKANGEDPLSIKVGPSEVVAGCWSRLCLRYLTLALNSMRRVSALSRAASN